jgi:hypothetical protein
LNSKKLGNLECKESNNFSEIGDSIVNKKNTTKAIFPSHVLSNPSKMHFDLSEYDDEQMNEKSQILQEQKRLQLNHEGSISWKKHLINDMQSKSVNLLGSPKINIKTHVAEFLSNSKSDQHYKKGTIANPVVSQASKTNSQFKVMKGSYARGKTMKMYNHEERKGRSEVFKNKIYPTVEHRSNKKISEDQCIKEKLIHSSKKIYQKRLTWDFNTFKMPKALIKDDACISEKELGSNNSINTPMPGITIKTQFQKEIHKMKKPGGVLSKLSKKKIKNPNTKCRNDFKLPNYSSPFMSSVLSEPSRQRIRDIHPHINCNN